MLSSGRIDSTFASPRWRYDRCGGSASCSTAGALSFSTELLDLDSDLIDYVIVHELLHLRAPNHGRLWKSLMRAHLGEYESLHNRLREHAGSALSGATEAA
jgi:predicted metal-dependent hydrolase